MTIRFAFPLHGGRRSGYDWKPRPPPKPVRTETALNRGPYRAHLKKRIPLSVSWRASKTPAPMELPRPPRSSSHRRTSITDCGPPPPCARRTVEDEGFEMFGAGGTHVINDPSPILVGNVCLALDPGGSVHLSGQSSSYAYDDLGENVIGLATIYERSP